MLHYACISSFRAWQIYIELAYFGSKQDDKKITVSRSSWSHTRVDVRVDIQASSQPWSRRVCRHAQEVVLSGVEPGTTCWFRAYSQARKQACCLACSQAHRQSCCQAYCQARRQPSCLACSPARRLTCCQAYSEARRHACCLACSQAYRQSCCQAYCQAPIIH